MHNLAVRLSEFLARNSNFQGSQDEIRYGLEVFLGAAFQVVIIIGIAFSLGIGKEVAIILISAALLRRYSGGIHCQAYYRCTLCGIFVFTGLGCLAHVVKTDYFAVVFPLSLLLAGMIVYWKAPVDNPANPIVDVGKRQSLKYKSIAILLMLFVTAFVAGQIGYAVAATSILIGLLWQSFTLTPGGHLFINTWDKVFASIENNFQGKEGYNDEQI